jgi:hypothetical protein
MQFEPLKRLSKGPGKSDCDNVFKFADAGLLLLTLHPVGDGYNAIICFQIPGELSSWPQKISWPVFCNLKIENSCQQSNNGPELLLWKGN